MTNWELCYHEKDTIAGLRWKNQESRGEYSHSVEFGIDGSVILDFNQLGQVIGVECLSVDLEKKCMTQIERRYLKKAPKRVKRSRIRDSSKLNKFWNPIGRIRQW